MELCSEILYQPSPFNSVADCLSQVPASTVTLKVDYNELAAPQASSLDVQALQVADTLLCLVDVSLMGHTTPSVQCFLRPSQSDGAAGVPVSCVQHAKWPLQSRGPGVCASQQLIIAHFI